MEGDEEESSNGNHAAVEDEELRLVLHDFVPPSGSKLSDTEDATGEDGDESDEETGNEKLEAGRCDQIHGSSTASCLPGAEDIIADEEGESHEGDNLPDDTSNHEVGSYILTGTSCVRAGSQASTCTLQYKREQIAANEDPGVISGGNAR